MVSKLRTVVNTIISVKPVAVQINRKNEVLDRLIIVSGQASAFADAIISKTPLGNLLIAQNLKPQVHNLLDRAINEYRR